MRTLVIAFFLLSLPAEAQDLSADRNFLCTTRERAQAAFAIAGQEVTARGVTLSGALLEIWANPDGAFWILTITTPDGAICKIDEGSDWEKITAGWPI